jgi:hypothetical protein
MSLDDFRASVEARFKTQWMTGSPAALRTPVGFDGQAFTPPTDSSSVRMAILNGEAVNQSMGDPGSNVVRYPGVVMFQIFTPGGAGSKAARDLADLIRPIFTNWRSGSILFRAMTIGTPVEDAPHYMLPVSFAFQDDQFHG